MPNDPLLEIKAGIQVSKPATQVFEAIADPDQMKNYFISKSSGRLTEGGIVKWKFPEMDIEFDVKTGKIEKDKYISFYWDAAMDGEQTFVEINLQALSAGITLVVVTEKSKPNTEAGIKWLKSNTEGWANFLACLKAWMEYGVHLREGAFNPSQMPV